MKRVVKRRLIQKTILICFASAILAIAVITARNEVDKGIADSQYIAMPDRVRVSYKYCYDGDTASFVFDDNSVRKVRFLHIDTPEYDEEYGKEAMEYTSGLLASARIIEIEYDKASRRYDEFGRELAYVWCDDQLINELIVRNGFAFSRYGKNDYKYHEQIENAELQAKTNGINIRKNNE